MFTLVRFADSKTTSVDKAALLADYLRFERQRASCRRYLKAFGGLALVVIAGAALGRVPLGEAEIAAALLLAPLVTLLIAESIRWRRLVCRLDRVRAEVQSVRKS
jgi:hypothetical protein